MQVCSSGHSAIAYEGLFCPVCELRNLIAELEEKVETLWAMAEEAYAEKTQKSAKTLARMGLAA